MGAVTFASSTEAGKTPGLAFHYSTHEGRTARRALVLLAALQPRCKAD